MDESLPEPRDLRDAPGEVFADHGTKKVVARFLDPATGEMAVEIHLDPETARELAASLTEMSIAVEEYGRP